MSLFLIFVVGVVATFTYIGKHIQKSIIIVNMSIELNTSNEVYFLAGMKLFLVDIDLEKYVTRNESR